MYSVPQTSTGRVALSEACKQQLGCNKFDFNWEGMSRQRCESHCRCVLSMRVVLSLELHGA